MTTILQGQDIANGQVLYIALELSNKKWKLGFSNGSNTREVTIEAGDLSALQEPGRVGTLFVPTRNESRNG